MTFYIDNYYDKKLSKNYIITGNKGFIKSYDYNNNKIYHKYYDNSKKAHYNIIIIEEMNNIKLIESCFDGNIRIWDFHLCLLLKKIKINDEGIKTICLWDKNYLFIGCRDKKIKLIDLKNGLIIKNLISHNNEVITIKKINHSKYGKCLLSQGWKEDGIKIWININNL